MIGGDTESSFYRETEKYLATINAESDATEVIEKVDALLAKEIPGSINKKDYYARNRLLEIKHKYLKQLIERKDQKIKQIKNTVANLEKHKRTFSALKTKAEEEILKKVKDLENQLTLSRKKFKNTKVKTVEPTAKNSSFSFGDAISEDMKILGQLWGEKKNEIRFAILKELATAKYTNALKVIQDNQTKFTGTYRKWLDRQKAFIDDAREVWDYVELNLSEIRETYVTIGDERIYVSRVYPQSAEIENDQEDLFKLTEISTEDFLKIYATICEATGKKPVNGAAYAVSKFDFNEAFKISQMTAESWIMLRHM